MSSYGRLGATGLDCKGKDRKSRLKNQDRKKLIMNKIVKVTTALFMCAVMALTGLTGAASAHPVRTRITPSADCRTYLAFTGCHQTRATWANEYGWRICLARLDPSEHYLCDLAAGYR